MATIVVETGAQIAGANSYVSEAELSTYAADRGITITGTNSILLIQAMDYIEQQAFIGYKLTETQALQWPRGGAYVDGYAIDQDEIPTLLKEAQMETALAFDAGTSPLNDISRATKREKVGQIEVEYMDSAASSTLVLKISNKLSKLITGSATGLSFKVIRG